MTARTRRGGRYWHVVCTTAMDCAALIPDGNLFGTLTMSTTADKAPAPAEILHPASRNLFRHWEAIRGERNAAARSAVDLREIHQLLPWVFISEPVFGSGDHRFRLAGTGICAMWQDNLTGKCPFTAWPTFERRTIGDLLKGTIENCQPFAMRVRAKTAGNIQTGLEIMGLPVAVDDSSRHQVLGIIIPFRQPEWLGRDRLTAFELSSVRIIWTDQLPPPAMEDGRQVRHLSRTKPALEVIRGGKPN